MSEEKTRVNLFLSQPLALKLKLFAIANEKGQSEVVEEALGRHLPAVVTFGNSAGLKVKFEK